VFGLILLVLILIWYYFSLNNFDFFLPSIFFPFTLLVLTIWYLVITWTELAEIEKTELKNLSETKK